MRPSEHYEQILRQHFGPLVPLSAVWKWLAYPSVDAARQAYRRGRGPIPSQRLSHRRGVFLRSDDLAQWLVAERIEIRALASATENFLPPD